MGSRTIAIDALRPPHTIRRGFRMPAAGDRGFSRALLDPVLIAGSPVSILRGALSTPLVSLYLLTTIAISPSVDALQIGSWSTPAQLLLTFVCMNSSVVAMRVVLVGLIEERNRFLSHAIRVACMRQPGALVKDSTSHAGASSNESAPLAPVVAVLGLAHIYGVRQLLSEMAEETSDTCA